MLDTVKLRSPYLSDRDAQRVEQSCLLRQELAISTGEVNWSLTTGSLRGSWDERVSVRVQREELVRLDATKESKASVVSRACPPYLLVEGSVHKALMGHNVHGGPLEPVLAVNWFLAEIGRRLDVTLPDGDEWRYLRVDWAECFDMGKFDGCQEYMSGLNMAQFPRRKVARFGVESLHAAGTTTAVKIYHKGPEFHKHDRPRLKGCLDPGRVVELQNFAHRVLRCETSIKAKKLAEEFGDKPLVVEVTRPFLERVHDREMSRLLREAEIDMRTVRTHREVTDRLHEVYNPRDDRGSYVNKKGHALANNLLGTWTNLSLLGEAEVKKRMPCRTFYEHRKMLTDAGCSWHAADVFLMQSRSAIPEGFSPVRGDSRRLVDEAEEVKLQLQTFCKAA